MVLQTESCYFSVGTECNKKSFLYETEDIFIFGGRIGSELGIGRYSVSGICIRKEKFYWNVSISWNENSLTVNPVKQQ